MAFSVRIGFTGHGWWLLSLTSLTVVLVPVVVALGTLLWHSQTLMFSNLLTDVYIWQVVWFSWLQASVSTLLSLMLAIPIARALARRQHFFGRRLLLRCFSLALVVPTLVAVHGMILLHGHQGWINQLIISLGGSGYHYLYGLGGILLAHVFFNMPLAARIVLQRLETIAPETWRLASQLGLSSKDIWWHIEWPHLRTVLLPLAGLIFALCFTSFAIVMTLGGGPKATTLEVSIYQALRFAFDLDQAVLLSLLQLVCCGLILWVGLRLGRPLQLCPSTQQRCQRPDLHSVAGRLFDGWMLLLAVLLVLLPLLAIVVAGSNDYWHVVLDDKRLWYAAGNSLWIALNSALLTVMLAMGLLLARRHLQLRLGWHRAATALEWSGSVILAFPPLVLGAGLFLALRSWTDVFALSLYLVVLVNTLMGLPFALHILSAPYLQLASQYDRLCSSLGLAGWHRFRLLEWPRLRHPLAFSLALTAAMSAGDLGIIALFGTPDVSTLPLLMYQRLGSYQGETASVTALVLLGLCLGLFIVLEQGLRGKRD